MDISQFLKVCLQAVDVRLRIEDTTEDITLFNQMHIALSQIKEIRLASFRDLSTTLPFKRLGDIESAMGDSGKVEAIMKHMR